MKPLEKIYILNIASANKKQSIFYYLICDVILCCNQEIALMPLYHYEINDMQIIDDDLLHINHLLKAFHEKENLINDIMIKGKTSAVHKDVWIARQYRKMQTTKYLNYHLFDIEKFPKAIMDNDSQCIYLNQSLLPDSQALELITGPLLISFLAHQNIICFHASSIINKMTQSAMLFMAESGTGKSTIAKQICALSEKFLQVGDDIMPAVIKANQPYIKPFYPQLKLSESQQYCRANQKLTLQSFIKLKPQDDLNTPVTLSKISPTKSLLFILKHGVAIHAFEQKLRQFHFSFANEINQLTNCYELTYPRRMDIYADISDILEREFS